MVALQHSVLVCAIVRCGEIYGCSSPTTLMIDCLVIARWGAAWRTRQLLRPLYHRINVGKCASGFLGKVAGPGREVCRRL